MEGASLADLSILQLARPKRNERAAKARSSIFMEGDGSLEIKSPQTICYSSMLMLEI
jgi:hypothetical protein